MPPADKSHAESRTESVLCASVAHRRDDVSLLVRTASGACTLLFTPGVAKAIGSDLAAKRVKLGRPCNSERAPIEKPSGGTL